MQQDMQSNILSNTDVAAVPVKKVQNRHLRHLGWHDTDRIISIIYCAAHLG